MNEPVAIQSADFWVKVVVMLQQNWALIEAEEKGDVRVYFVTDASGVFDEIAFSSASAAREALGRNGFKRFARMPIYRPFCTRRQRRSAVDYSPGHFWQS